MITSFRILLSVILLLWSGSSYAHVVPNEELKNNVYLTKKEVLKDIFKGARKIRKVKQTVSPQNRKLIETITHHPCHRRNLDLFTGKNGQGETLFVALESVQANSHPVAKMKVAAVIGPDGHLKNVIMMEYQGPQWQEMPSSEFLKQFSDMNADSDFSTVRSNQGQTRPVQALSNSIQELLVTFKFVFIDK